MSPLLVRPARPADADAIAHVHVETWRQAYPGLVPQAHLDSLRDEDYEAKWRKILADVPPRMTHRVAARDGEVVGFVSAGPARGEPAGTGEIHAIYVLPRAWSLGAGRALMNAALDFLRDTGHADAILWVLTDNARSRRFYAQLGMSPDGGTSAEPVGGTALAHVRYRVALVRNETQGP